MTGETESQPEESRERGETSEGRESSEQQRLDDATLDPGALIEQSGDIRQAETTQEAFTALVENAGDLSGSEPQIAVSELEATAAVVLQTEDGSVTGSLPGMRGDLDQVTVGGSETVKGDEATPITLPGARGQEATPITLPNPTIRPEEEERPPEASELDHSPFPEEGLTTPESESVLGGMPKIRGDLNQVTVGGSETVKGDEATPITLPGARGQEATPITLPGARGTASEQAATEGRGMETSSELQQATVEYTDEPPPPPPDMERRGAETGAGPEGGGARVMSAIPLAGAENAVTADILAAESGSLEQPDQALEGGEVGPGSEADLDTSASQVKEGGTAIGTETEADQEALGEGEEGWTPPSMYAHVDSSGTVTIVDENGKPIDSPPTVTKVVGEDGKEKYMASYEAGGKTYSFEVTSYISSLSDLYVGYDKDGKLTVVNGKGETVDSPPVFTKFVDDKGVEKYSAYYPGAGQGSGVVLEAYSGSLQDCYAHIGQDGKVTIVDADGNPLNSQPATYKFVDDKGVEHVAAYYPGAGESGKVTLSSYTASLEGYHSTTGQDGKVTIVDADGNPLKCQPATYKFVDNKGVEHVTAYYPGAGESEKVTLSSYTSPLQGCYSIIGQDGKVTIVDAEGNPLPSQPATYKFVDNKGVEHIAAYYPGAGESGKVTLSSYTTSLQNCYAHVGQDGKVTVVGADGKPLNSQPLTYKYVDGKGVEHILAYYPGDSTKTTMTDYLPPSGKTKSGGSV